MFKKGIGVIVSIFDITLCLLMLNSLKLPRFPFLLMFPSQGEDDDLLEYTITLPTPPTPTPAAVPVKPLITQVYSQPQNPPVYSPTPAASSSNLVQNNNLLIALHKGKSQCAHPISSFVSYNHFSSSFCSFIASLDSISLPNIVRKALSHPG